MGGKGSFFRVRADERLKAALKASADRANRQEADQARHLIMLALGLIDDSEEKTVQERLRQHQAHDRKVPVRRPQSA